MTNSIKTNKINNDFFEELHLEGGVRKNLNRYNGGGRGRGRGGRNNSGRGRGRGRGGRGRGGRGTQRCY